MSTAEEPLKKRSESADEDAQTEEPQIDQHRVAKRQAGKRIDVYLHYRYPRISRTVLQRQIKQGLVTVNGMPTKASYEPAADDVIEIRLPAPPPSRVQPENIPLDIVYEDEWVIAINKQEGIICHPARAAQSGTVANAVAYHAEQLSHGDDPFRPGIVHRLDKNTTGLMLIAKTDEAHWRLSMQFERRTIRKEYFAICEGRISLDGDIINQPLAPHPITTQRMVLASAMPPRQAMFKEAITEYRVEKRYNGFTTVRLFPKTGRTHQLRLHMSSIGHPMVGDTMYGGSIIRESDFVASGSEVALFEHQALHARRLRLVHPIREEPLELEAPLPDRLQRFLELLKKCNAD